MNREQQHGVRRFFVSRIFLLVLAILATLIAIGYGRAFYQDYKIKKEIERLQSEVKGLERKKLESMEILGYVLSKNYVEDKARTELNMKKPGENVAFITNPAQAVASHEKTLATEERNMRPLNNPMKWWYYFTHQTIPNNL